MNVILGSNDFYGVPFPLVLYDRFFHIYQSGSGFKLDIFRWDENKKQPIYEVKEGKSIDDSIRTNPTGIVTFSEPTKGTFLYKFRPKPGTSQIFGKVPIDNETEIIINDKQIKISVNGKAGSTFTRNSIIGLPIGIQIFADGGMAMGVNKLPEGMVLTRK